MPPDDPISDTSRARHSNPDQTWPESVKVQLIWKDEHGRNCVRTEHISGDMFFGRNSYGAPLEGAALIQKIELMRRAGPPKFKRRGNDPIDR